MLLGLGTTFGVATLALACCRPCAGPGSGCGPRSGFAPGVARQAAALAAAGDGHADRAELAVLGVVFLTNYADPPGGALTVYNFSWAVYLLPLRGARGADRDQRVHRAGRARGGRGRRGAATGPASRPRTRAVLLAGLRAAPDCWRRSRGRWRACSSRTAARDPAAVEHGVRTARLRARAARLRGDRAARPGALRGRARRGTRPRPPRSAGWWCSRRMRCSSSRGARSR